MTEVYDWAYVNPRACRALDRNLVVSTLLFLNDQRLMQRYLQQIRPGMRVWQSGPCVWRSGTEGGCQGAQAWRICPDRYHPGTG
jgi:hypothetical protein